MNIILPSGSRPVIDLQPEIKKDIDISKEINLKNGNFDRLTKSELNVALLILKAHRNKEIAEILKLGYGTVAKYVSNIYRKTSTENRIELIMKFAKSGQ